MSADDRDNNAGDITLPGNSMSSSQIPDTRTNVAEKTASELHHYDISESAALKSDSPSAFRSSVDHLEPLVLKSLSEHATRLAELSHSIWLNPELSLKEFHAVGLLTTYLKNEGYRVTCPFGGLETAFLGEFQTAGFDRTRHSTVAVLCEYDALPGLGHACGHNLIAEAGLGTFIAVCETLKITPGIEGKVVCMGTPAEEGPGGKIMLIKAGAFESIDFAMMVHPAPVDILDLAILGVDECTVEFYGKAAHASCGPWVGVNALDAAVTAYNTVSLLRQQLPVAHQIHMTIMNGGKQANIIPDYTLSTYCIRAPTSAAMDALRCKFKACLDAAALATGCTVKYQFKESAFGPLMNNQLMLSVYRHYGTKNGMIFPTVPPSYGSTDMGNVSTVVPSIHPTFAAGGLEMIHTKAFEVLAGEPAAHKLAQRAASAMAMVTLELLASPDFRRKVTAEFQEHLKTFAG